MNCNSNNCFSLGQLHGKWWESIRDEIHSTHLCVVHKKFKCLIRLSLTSQKSKRNKACYLRDKKKRWNKYRPRQWGTSIVAGKNVFWEGTGGAGLARESGLSFATPELTFVNFMYNMVIFIFLLHNGYIKYLIYYVYTTIQTSIGQG